MQTVVHLSACAHISVHVCVMFECLYPCVILLLVDHLAREQEVTVDGGACVGS